MSTDILTQDFIKSVLSYCPNTGLFTWIKGRNIGKQAGYIDAQGYVNIKILNKARKAHRIAYLYVYGEHPANSIDHINHITNDNRIVNLRSCTHRENHANRKKNNKFVGVEYDKSRHKWSARIRVNYKNIFLGRYNTHLAACYARHQANINLI